MSGEKRALIRGLGGYLPERVLTNADLAKMVDTTDSWIVERTGIRERHIAADNETTSTLAARAAGRALTAAGMRADEIELIVLATATPDQTFPATAARVQAMLGAAAGGAAFDVQAVCSGFLFATGIADNFLARAQFRNALVIGAETFSRILDWTDRTTCVLFGDGAGAMVLTAEDMKTAGDRGIMGVELHTDGSKHDLLFVDGGPSSTKTVGHLRMQGNQVFKHAVVNLSNAIESVARRHGVPLAEVDWFIPHQANQRILEAVARRIGIDENRVISTLASHANTSAASIPLAFAEAMDDGRIRPGNLTLMEAMGGGFSWGAALARL